MSNPPKAKKLPQLSTEELQQRYNAMQNDLQNLAGKIGELESEADEHSLVLTTLEEVLAEEPDRKCFRLIGGVLVERTVKDVVPALQTNRDGIQKVIANLSEQYKTKEKDFDTFRTDYKIRAYSLLTVILQPRLSLGLLFELAPLHSFVKDMAFNALSLILCFISLFVVAGASFPHGLGDFKPHRRAAPQASIWLATHNAVREEHGAQPLSWSPFLAAKAQEWANQCEFRNTQGVLSSTPYGENIVAGTGAFPIYAAVGQFTKDASSYNPQFPNYSHFTQVVWKSTTELGCATAQCDGIFDARLGKATLHVCLYNPAGNVVGEAPENVQL
ncbi:hypothetical protein CCMSSC00406_0001060 [Pleurotus cornucopiae]|uniref:Uncharacterized protein n=1 Tax=Pleurotus cornucopiae TaxID=5321 RepID=A0ACB7IP76_PLECO|nr:hypothetical protein CCMSSC00406_0001060 [Pleurotus cornucopiae]